jgi:hypothetical protein
VVTVFCSNAAGSHLVGDVTTTIDKVIFKHFSREANKVAHELDKFSFLNKQSSNCVDKYLAVF